MKDQLQNPEVITNNTPFFIYYIKDGTKYRVVPPEDSLKANPQELREITAKLLTQLDTIDQHYQTPQVQALADKLQDSQARLTACKTELENRGISIPIVNKLPVFTFSSLTAAASSGKTAQPLPDAQSRANEGEFMLAPNTQVPPPVAPKPNRSGPKTPPPPPPPPIPSGGLSVLNDITFLKTDGTGLKKVQQTYLEPASPNGLAPIFAQPGVKNPNGKMASINAGHPDFGVGHSGINERFKTELHRAGHPTRDFKVFHELLINHHNESGRTRTLELLVNNSSANPLSCSAVYNKSGKKEDSIIFDVFRSAYCPGNNPDNAAMIYLVPPNGKKGYPNNEEGARQFLLDVKSKAMDLAVAQNEFNARIKESKDIPQLNVLRTCLFSGGLLRHDKTSDAQVAAAIKAGFDEALKAMVNPTIKEIQFEDGLQKHFENVAKP